MKYAAILLFVLSLSTAAHADAWVNTSVGASGIFKPGGFQAFEYGLELDLGSIIPVVDLSPVVGFLHDDFGAYYVYTGLKLTAELFADFELDLMLGGGYYHGGRGLDLGFPFEFREAVEFSFLVSDFRVAVGFHHLSHASLGGENPGNESAYLVLRLAL